MKRNTAAVIDVGMSVAAIEARDVDPESFASCKICERRTVSESSTSKIQLAGWSSMMGNSRLHDRDSDRREP